MEQLPLILEGRNPIDIGAGDTSQKIQNGTITVGRGQMVCALPIFFNPLGTVSSRVFSLSFGGESVWQKSGMLLYNLQYGFNTNKLKYVPLDYGEGQTFSFTIQVMERVPLFNINPLSANLIFMYEGFHMEREFIRNKAQHYIGFYSEFEGVLTEKIEDILPKERGDIVGFRIQVEQFGVAFPNTVQQTFLNLNISGIEIVKDIPIEYFNAYSTDVHEYYFDKPIQGGAPFELRMESGSSSIAEGTYGIDWIFDDVRKISA